MKNVVLKNITDKADEIVRSVVPVDSKTLCERKFY